MASLATPNSTESLTSPSLVFNGHAPPLAALEAIGARPWQVQQRPTKQASYELCNHAKAYLEGGQYASGFDFLHSLLAAGTSISTPAQPYIGFLAPPAYIAFASSLVVHPRYTTHTTSNDVRKGPDAALRYLRCVRTTIEGPAYKTIRKAFTFPEEHLRRRGAANRIAAEIFSPGKDGDIERIAGPAANEESLWVRAEDFWHIVGWAFNCSTAHEKRWDRWKLWLSNMLDFLEADWEACVKRSKMEKRRPESELQESLLWRYIAGNTETVNRSIRRRIVKAIFAMATPESLKDYPEIWINETVGPKHKTGDDQPLGKVDFETGEMGHYDSDEDMPDMPEETGSDSEAEDSMSAPPKDGGNQNTEDALERLGGMDAIELRQRVIALLTRVTEKLPKQFTTQSEFFDDIRDDLLTLPINNFNALLSTMKLPPRTQVTFNVNLFHPLVTGTLPNYFRFDPEQEDFQKILLPLEAATQSFSANAKVALILEQIFIYMINEKTLKPTVALRKAMEAGIKARHAVKKYKGKHGNTEDKQQAKMIMEACSERLRGLWELLEMAGKMGPRGLAISHATESDTDGDDQQRTPTPRKGDAHKKRKRGSGPLTHRYPKRK